VGQPEKGLGPISEAAQAWIGIVIQLEGRSARAQGVHVWRGAALERPGVVECTTLPPRTLTGGASAAVAMIPRSAESGKMLGPAPYNSAADTAL
jgi:hypothetical protein